MSIARGTDLTVAEAEFEGVPTHWTDCVGVTTTIEVEQAIDLLDAPTIDAPAGSWCGLAVVTRGPFVIVPDSDAGFGIDISLALGALSLSGAAPFFVNGSRFVLALGSPGWLDAAELDADDADVVINTGSEGHGLLAARAAGGAALYEDDGDGEVSQAEREGGPVADGGGDDHDDR